MPVLISAGQVLKNPEALGKAPSKVANAVSGPKVKPAAKTQTSTRKGTANMPESDDGEGSLSGDSRQSIDSNNELESDESDLGNLSQDLTAKRIMQEVS